MATLLHIKSSILGDHSQSSHLSDRYVQGWLAANPGGQVTVRDIGREPLPHLDAERIGAFATPADRRNDRQQALAAEGDALIDELREADVLVLAIPMYNFGVPSQLKAWFDHVARAGVSFEYTANGPRGLLGDKAVQVFATRGGIYHANGIDHQIPYVKQFLAFIGFTRVEVTYAEGLNMTQHRDTALAKARDHIDGLLSTLVPAA